LPDLQVNGTTYLVDEYGFLREPESWNETIARELARIEGIPELTGEHWKAIHYTRSYYERYGVAPMIRKLCHETGLTVKRLRELFPCGPIEGAIKLAGLPVPKPTACMGSCLTCGAFGTRLCQPPERG
jgi:TusE/DsrC/DsvC family sulfur relay protein